MKQVIRPRNARHSQLPPNTGLIRIAPPVSAYEVFRLGHAVRDPGGRRYYGLVLLHRCGRRQRQQLGDGASNDHLEQLAAQRPVVA